MRRPSGLWHQSLGKVAIIKLALLSMECLLSTIMLCIQINRFEEEEEAISIANATPFGLAGE